MQTKEQFLNSLVKKEDKVKEALVKLYQGVRATNEFLGLDNSKELQDTYYKLRGEEVGELFTAIENQDKVEFLDAVVDGLVVVGYEYFLVTDKLTENEIPIYNEDTLNYHIQYLHKMYTGEHQVNCTISLKQLENIFNKLYIEHMKAVNEVLESNWSKFPTVDEFGQHSFWSVVPFKGVQKVKLEELINYQVKYIEGFGRYVGVHHEIRVDNEGKERIIFWANGEKQPNGSVKEFKAPKYVKPCTYKNPDFASCWLN